MLEQVRAPPHAVYGLVCLHVQQRLNLYLQPSPPVACNRPEVVAFLGGVDDVGLAVLQLVKLLELEDPAVLLRLCCRLVVASELHFSQNEASVDDGIACAEHCLLDVGALHIGVPADHVLLAFVVHENNLLLYVLCLAGGSRCVGRRRCGRWPRRGTAEAEQVALATGVSGWDGGLRLRLRLLCRLGGGRCRSWRSGGNCGSLARQRVDSFRAGRNTVCLRALLRPLLGHRIELVERAEGDEVVVALAGLLVQGFSKTGEGVWLLLFVLWADHGVEAADRVCGRRLCCGCATGGGGGCAGALLCGVCCRRRCSRHRRGHGALEAVPFGIHVIGGGGCGRGGWRLHMCASGRSRRGNRRVSHRCRLLLRHAGAPRSGLPVEVQEVVPRCLIHRSLRCEGPLRAGPGALGTTGTT
mmetsp:Transcript_150570/g.419644  ORF Transcript_150570/g.419644 Transcript_150570/m.419644 type:complete len:413 (+) Transcript_150570:1262-2500(+)